MFKSFLCFTFDVVMCVYVVPFGRSFLVLFARCSDNISILVHSICCVALAILHAACSDWDPQRVGFDFPLAIAHSKDNV